ncbi:uncharacterized protein Triagg1_5005 [Trichoderma aggressivum f. europaeum]|uniref:Rab-GAP TBC domain-containing protein n=1 Tax=Trichoderma aggressivum f. europaeum TaxID=173218 RepID=A0AAE1M5I2_9HYPO|nr:hypothetical protein Triagg1_5005 [Trichoderma aggressivum f. europaeum]
MLTCCAKIFLLSKDGDNTKIGWSRSLREKRESYNERRDHFLKFINHPEALTELTIDPLADDPKSPWNTVREDEVTRAEILQDVQRLPDEANYHEDYMQRMILDILFVYCKVNPSRGGYRQGMHELLAPILHVVEQDALDRESTTASDDEDNLEELMLETIDQSFVEHDAFILFSQLMEHAQSFYEVKDVPNSSPPTDGPSQPRFPEQSSAIVERSKFIHEVCLQKVDPELAAHLASIEILPQIFLIRWIRLLFSREFPFNQFLVLWDTILAVDPSLDLIDLVCCAMLLRIRWQLLESDYSVCLQLLLKYPPPNQLHGPHTFVDDALYLRDHMNAHGGATLIKKYSGRLPNVQKSAEPAERVSSPLAGLDSIRKKGFGLKSPIRSPSKFLQQQGGVENMIQGVLEKSEKLGINQALRDAVGEIKRNMQGLNEGLSSPYPRVVLADDGAVKALAVMQRRNDQLASLLEETVMSLRALSLSNLEDKARSLGIIEVAAAKVQFVQIYLQDATMDIPTADSPTSEEAQLAAEKRGDKEIKKASPPEKENQPLSPGSGTNVSGPNPSKANTKLGDVKKPKEIQDPLSNAAEATSNDSKKEEVLSEGQLKAPVTISIPARSTIAQSSFSWMLEPEESGPPQTPPVGKSPTASQKRRNNNASREKNAFLFGEAPAELDERDPLRSGDIFGMEPMPTPPAKGK